MMLNFVPGPTEPLKSTVDEYKHFLGSPRLNENFWEDYSVLHTQLQTLLQTQNQVAIMTGEGMLALWAGLKSIIQADDCIVCVVNGLYGEGIANIAESLGASVTRVTFQDTEFDLGTLMQAIEHVKPKMITVVHCETPTGLLNPIQEIASIKRDFGVPLLYVDAISSIGATPVNMDANHIDILLGSSPKALSSLADISFVAVSDNAWHFICKQNYNTGYDALLPFKDIHCANDIPYMPHWQGIRSLRSACQHLLNEGLSKVYERHLLCMQTTTETLIEIGYQLFQSDTKLYSPSVTCCKLPANLSFHKFNKLLTNHGVQFGAGIGDHGKEVFRIGHMGTQANIKNLKKALSILRKTIAV